jgi:hypothetical protein
LIFILPSYWLSGVDERLNRLGILRCRILEDARYDEHEVGGRAQHRIDALRRRPVPVEAHDHVEAGLGAILLADPANLVGTLVV